jgi:hypothetical protein
MGAIKKIKIYKIETKTYADIYYKKRTKETMQWDFDEDRNRVLKQADGETIFIDTRPVPDK